MTTTAEWLTTFPKLLDLEPEDRAWAVNWLRHASGDWGLNQRPGNLANDLLRVRRWRPRALHWLLLNSTKAAQIAANAAWPDTTPSKSQPTQDEIAAVEATLAALKPADPIRSTHEQLDALSGSLLRPYHLSPQQLDAANPLPNGRKRAP